MSPRTPKGRARRRRFRQPDESRADPGNLDLGRLPRSAGDPHQVRLEAPDHALHEREKHLEHVLHETERARNESETLLSEHRKQMARAADEVRGLLEQARQDGQ